MNRADPHPQAEPGSGWPALSPPELQASGRTAIPVQLPSSVSKAFEVVLFVFIMGLLLTDVVPGIGTYNRMLGISLVLLALSSFVGRKGRLPREVLLAAAFVAWGAVTGAIVAPNRGALVNAVRVLVQELALFFAVAEYVKVRRSARAIFTFLAFVPLLLAVYAYFTGEWYLAAEAETYRLSSVMRNANAAGILSLFGLFGVAYLSRRERDLRLRILPLFIIPAIVAIVVFSASRKSLLTIGLFVALWVYLLLKASTARKARAPSLALALVVLISAFFVVRTVLPRTYFGTRLQKAATTQAAATRANLYREGWQVARHHALTGVGLGNFVIISEAEAYTHSDYLETLATTGIVGFVLYMGVLFSLFRRLGRIRRAREEVGEDAHYRAGLYIAILVTTMVLGLGLPNFTISHYWIILGAVVGHAGAIEDSLGRGQRPEGRGEAQGLGSGSRPRLG